MDEACLDRVRSSSCDCDDSSRQVVGVCEPGFEGTTGEVTGTGWEGIHCHELD